MQAVCAACRIIDGDSSLKECSFCEFCDSWLCEADRTHVARRAVAMLKRIFEPDYNGKLSLDEGLKEQADAEYDNITKRS